LKRQPVAKIGVLIILCLLLNVGLPSLIFGINTIPGLDEVRLFNRGKAISTGEVDIYHAWSQQELIDPYPPGYPIIVSEILTMIPSIDPFGVSFILRICLLSLMLISYFWVGSYISRRVAYLVVLFRSVVFIILSSNPGNYVYIFPTQVAIGGGIYTEICIIMTSIFMIRYFYHRGSDRSNLIIIFFLAILHGLTHISGFVTYTFFMIILLLLIQIPVLLQSTEFHRWRFRYILAVIARSRLQKPGYILMLSPLIVYLMYYSILLNQASPDFYILEQILPIQIPLELYILLMLTSFIIGFTALIFGWNRQGTDEGRIWPMPFFIPSRTKKILLSLYLLLFTSIVFISNLDPSLFAYSSFAVTTGFPSVFPSMNPIPILSFSMGMILFLLTSYGLIKMMDSIQVVERYFAFLYLGSYCFFSVLYLSGWLSPSRAMFFLMFVPLMIGGSLTVLSSTIVNSLGRIISRSYRATAKQVRFISIMIIVIFVIVAVVSRANLEPTIRGDVSVSPSVLSFGAVTPPLVTNKLVDAVNKFQTPGNPILSTPDTQIALYAFVEMKPLCPSYNRITYMAGNLNFQAMVASLYYLGDQTPEKWLRYNHGTLIVLGYMDMNGGSPDIGNFVPPVGKMINDTSLMLVWQDSYGEKIFQLK